MQPKIYRGNQYEDNAKRQLPRRPPGDAGDHNMLTCAYPIFVRKYIATWYPDYTANNLNDILHGIKPERSTK